MSSALTCVGRAAAALSALSAVPNGSSEAAPVPKPATQRRILSTSHSHATSSPSPSVASTRLDAISPMYVMR